MTMIGPTVLIKFNLDATFYKYHPIIGGLHPMFTNIQGFDSAMIVNSLEQI